MKMGILMVAVLAIAAVGGLLVEQRPPSKVPHPVAASSGNALAVLGSNPPAPEPPSDSLQGRVREVIEVAQYTYLRLDTAQGEVWAAVSKAAVSIDSKVTVENPTRMERFESATLKRTFDVIYFGNLPAESTAAPRQLPPGHPSIDGATTPAPLEGRPTLTTQAEESDLKVALAEGSNAHSIRELFADSAQLAGKLLRVRGRVVKQTPGVQGKNYLRLRDGSSDRPDQRELVVTTQTEAQVGSTVTFEGTLRTDVDVGIGFRYPILLADARVIADAPGSSRDAARTQNP